MDSKGRADLKRSGRLKTIPTPAPSSRSIGAPSCGTAISNPSTQRALRELILSAAASLARTSVTPENAPEYPASVLDSGGNSCEPFAWYDRVTRSWRTWQRSLDGEWEPFSGTWPRAGMTRNGIAYQRPPSAPLIRGIGYSSWPTPRGPKYGADPKKLIRENRNKPSDLESAVKMWPTPTANCSTGAGERGTGGLNLQTAVKYATPQARDFRTGEPHRWEDAKRSRNLNDQIGGQLNPTWVEWLMGFPLGWTALDASETPSSRKSRKKSGG